MKKLITLFSILLLATVAQAQCPNYVLSENQNWEQNVQLLSYDSLNTSSVVKVSTFIEVENSPLGVFQTNCDSVFVFPTINLKEIQAYGEKYASVILQEKIKQWNKKK